MADPDRDPSLPLVSVAVVTYNQVEFLRECLDAILAQDYPELEIVVADDGSPDATPELVRDYQRRHPGRIVPLLSPINRGITANQNAALFACTGKYIAWMAGDDLMLPGKIARQVALMEAEPEVAICYHDLEVFDSDTGRTLRRHSDVDRPREGDIRTLVRHGAFNGAVSNMVRRSCSPPDGFDPRIPIASDWLYYVECLWSGGRIRYLPEVLGRHRRHANNTTTGSVRRPSLREIQDHLFSCESILSRAPHLRRDVDARRAYMLQSLRWIDGGRDYDAYLRAAFAYRKTPKLAAGIVGSALFGIRR